MSEDFNFHPRVEQAIDIIDAAFFSGDTFYPAANNAEITRMLERWSKSAKRWVELREEVEAVEGEE